MYEVDTTQLFTKLLELFSVEHNVKNQNFPWREKETEIQEGSGGGGRGRKNEKEEVKKTGTPSSEEQEWSLSYKFMT